MAGSVRRPVAAAAALVCSGILAVPTVAGAADETWLLSNELVTSSADYVLDVEAGSVGLVGDWDGDGTDTPAARTGNVVTTFDAAGGVRDRIAYGTARDTILSGDWDGDGIDTLAARRGNVYYLDNAADGGSADVVIGYGRAADQVLVGDWNGNGNDTLAVRRGNVYYIRNSITSGPADIVVGYGRATDQVLVGDWNGDGTDTLAVRRGNQVYVRNDFATAPAAFSFAFGVAGDDTYAGDWDGDGDDTLAVRRAGAPGSGSPPPGSGPPGSAPPSSPPPPAGDGEWHLAFADEFAGTSLDEDRWTRCYWWHEHWWDDPGCTNESTGELQWYSPDQVSVGGGALRLTAVDTPYTRTDGTTHPYRSAMVTTGRYNSDTSDPPRYAFTYGLVEMRARLPEGRGLWPALWLLPTSHESRPEIDVIEVLGQDPDIARFHYHYTGSDGDRESVGHSPTVADLSVGWHTYGLEWREDALIWSVDGVELWTYDGPGISDEPMYLLANLAVGGWPGPPDGSTAFPAVMEIDYIRVWQR